MQRYSSSSRRLEDRPDYGVQNRETASKVGHQPETKDHEKSERQCRDEREVIRMYSCVRNDLAQRERVSDGRPVVVPKV